MDPESVINLFDSCWFNHGILKNDPNDSWVKTHKSDNSDLKYSSLRSILVRSQSEDIGSSSFITYSSFSPNSVLKTIPSRKLDFETQKQEHEHEHEQVEQIQEQKTTIEEQMKKNKKRRHGMSKSLSDLEFEELKGFMDMGFVFSEQDRNSSLVEIIPGLQRLGEENEQEDEDDDDDDDVGDGVERRPYLSEAWDNLDRKLKKKEHNEEPPPVVLNWEIPVVGDEIEMKDNLKLWAHSVASIVR